MAPVAKRMARGGDYPHRPFRWQCGAISSRHVSARRTRRRGVARRTLKSRTVVGDPRTRRRPRETDADALWTGVHRRTSSIVRAWTAEPPIPLASRPARAFPAEWPPPLGASSRGPHWGNHGAHAGKEYLQFEGSRTDFAPRFAGGISCVRRPSERSGGRSLMLRYQRGDRTGLCRAGPAPTQKTPPSINFILTQSPSLSERRGGPHPRGRSCEVVQATRRSSSTRASHHLALHDRQTPVHRPREEG